ncbi:MAG: Fic family protein [Candidatus Omnitrophota bacterium]
MRKIIITDREKLKQILEASQMSRSQMAKFLEVSYKSVYRWLDKGIQPHPAQSRDIDGLFKEHVDLRNLILKLKKERDNPLKIIKADSLLRVKLFLELTYNSNAIEGSRLTRKETQAAIEGKRVKGKEFFEVLEAVNHENALKYILSQIKPGFRITEEYILKLHSIVMYNFSDKLPGKYRTGFVNLTNTKKALPSAQMVPVKMRQFVSRVNAYGQDIIGKVASDHYEFEAIHPFFDGNGRVGRLILITQFLSKGFAPAIIAVEDRYKYYLALSKGDMGDFRNLVQMVCDSILKGYGLLEK